MMQPREPDMKNDTAKKLTLLPRNGSIAVSGFPERAAQDPGAPLGFAHSSLSATPTVPRVLTGH